MKLVAIGAMILSLLTPRAIAEQPAEVSPLVEVASNKEHVYYMNALSITRGEEGQVKFWLRKLIRNPKEDNVASTQEHWVSDCPKKRQTLLAWIRYNAKDEVIDTAVVPQSEIIWMELAPNSVGELIFTIACGAMEKIEEDSKI